MHGRKKQANTAVCLHRYLATLTSLWEVPYVYTSTCYALILGCIAQGRTNWGKLHQRYDGAELT